ncbi:MULTISPECIES: 23S rRNA (guanosine(2251)-2'-O)-methyltransferase RlmB [unclassified Rhodanobacter]|jgi:23S rRNA (guanosine2251-2'-O)-methyltransferase|uniref:23S rRNA (guanosine(2251)-2'-O)-methyltransferase RlmB n=1 Tax=unclassified Rhodanobacter TaxID=2621553 RepID=UPI001615E0EF|nr:MULTISPECIES: 23S rRNA (guanosine(2251)-2'-O)-methyltransferase RlmB [unclassified Rhodanobacter]MBB6244536.1 23S rRNA (guanosine2251-2'-O)-methyltransferase [Rhodanobacter sp. MP1X3]MBB6248553.1 23S rRNA (guanosine2251-2'-O)-methyltransferase [Rhodanobacter sp. A1T4]
MSESWIVGINPVEGALSNDAERVRELVIEQGQRNARVLELAERAKALKITVNHRPREQLDKLAGEARHQGVAALYEAPPMAHENDLAALMERDGSNTLVLVLDGVTDPHNLGACLRSSAAAKVTAVIVPKDRAVGLTPVVRRASAGGADRVPLIAVTNLARTLRELKDAGVWITGLDGETETSIYAVDFKGPVAIVLGSEGEGMRRLTRELCDFVAKIPMPGTMESLNVSVATGVVLFEALRQRSAVK